MTQISRRTIARGAAWSVPVVAVGAATPAMAASQCQPTLTLAPGSCKCPGQSTNSSWGYFIKVCALDGNSCGGTAEDPTQITITSIVSNSNQVVWSGNATFNFPNCTDVLIGSSSNSANFLDIYYSVDDQPAPAPVRVAAPPNCDDIDNALGDCDAEAATARSTGTETTGSTGTETTG